MLRALNELGVALSAMPAKLQNPTSSRKAAPEPVLILTLLPTPVWNPPPPPKKAREKNTSMSNELRVLLDGGENRHRGSG